MPRIAPRIAAPHAAWRAAWLAPLAALWLAGCTGIVEHTASEQHTPAEAGSTGRQILLTVEQQDFSVLDLTGTPAGRYLRRRGYGAAPPDIDRVLDQLAADHGIERRQGWPIESLRVYCEVFEVPEGRDVDAVMQALLADPRVDLVQPMNTFEALAEAYDDPYVDLQAAAAELGVAEAHRLATGKGVVVAVIDTAIDSNHPELEGRIALERDLVDARRKPRAPEVHGTAVAGVIASIANNSEGIIGVAPDVRLAALRACWSVAGARGAALCSSFTLAQALETAISIEAAVVNMSLAGPPDPLLARLIDTAVARGIVVVAAAPAPEANTPFPASHERVLVARSSTAADGAADNHLPVPSDEILTTTPGAGYAFFSGTSLGAAQLSGVVALMIERDSSLDPNRVAELLAASTVRRAGRVSINACHAVESLSDLRICALPVEVAGRAAGSRSRL